MSSLFPPSGPQLPKLPAFSTLLIKGPYHASAPVHLCLSHLTTRPEAQALILTSSRPALASELDDEWLTTLGGHGDITSVSSRITLHYPPSPAHLAMFFATLSMPGFVEGPLHNPSAAFGTPPSLIVLHELSTYFLDTEAAYTVSSYLTSIAHALAAVALINAGQVGASATALAVFDSRLDQLKLPLVASVPAEGETGETELDSVAVLAERYFEWTGTAVKVASAQVGDTMRLHLVRQDSLIEEVTWDWCQSAGPERPNTERRGTVFSYVE